MSVVVSVVPAMRQLAQQRWQDEAKTLALPIALWSGEGEVTGDATGGIVLISINGGASSTKYAWSIEECEVVSNSISPITGLLSWTVGDLNLLGGSSGMQWQCITQVYPGGLGTYRSNSLQTAGNPGNTSAPPTRLNWGRPGASTFMAHSFTAPNILAEVNKLYSWGYMWDRSVIDQGSIPVRP